MAPENLKVHLQTTEQLLNELDVGIDKEFSKALAENKELGVTVANTDTEIKRGIGLLRQQRECISPRIR